MIVDYENMFSDAQAETTVATHASTNLIDFSVAGDANDAMFLHVTTNETLTSGGSATVQVKLQTDDNASFSSAVDVFDTGAVAFDNAVFTAGAHVFQHQLPVGVMERYARVVYVIGTAVLTAGKFDAYLAYNGGEKLTDVK